MENWQEKSLVPSEAVAGAAAECILCEESEAEAIGGETNTEITHDLRNLRSKMHPVAGCCSKHKLEQTR